MSYGYNQYDYLEGTDFSYNRTKLVYGGTKMHMNTYQMQAYETAIYKDIMYPIASLMLEASELADLFIKPRLRGDDKEPTAEEIIGEAGDVLWMLSAILKDAGITLEEVAAANLKKLKSRQDRGVLQGSGGER